jgi:hypothetical protein
MIGRRRFSACPTPLLLTETTLQKTEERSSGRSYHNLASWLGFYLFSHHSCCVIIITKPNNINFSISLSHARFENANFFNKPPKFILENENIYSRRRSFSSTCPLLESSLTCPEAVVVS